MLTERADRRRIGTIGGMGMSRAMEKSWMRIALAAIVLAAVCPPLLSGGTQLSAFFFGGAAQAGFFPAQQEAARVLIPGGQALGVALRTHGVMVVAKPEDAAAGSALRVGDVILTVGGQAVDSAKALSAQLGAQQTDEVTLGIRRGSREMEVGVSAPADAAGGARRLGVWVRDSTAGVGTLTYVDPATGAYGALGHAIIDADTGALLEAAEGAVMTADIVGVTRGERGKAGELRGSFLKENRQIGTLALNSERGIYGVLHEQMENALYPQGLPVGDAQQVHPGAATILSTVTAGGMQAYAIEIVRVFPKGMSGGKDMIIRVTDERLLAATGGIVQGMSGSPIIQDGKLIGAVTHVLVNDPTRGYGIFIENMLDAAG